uniref:Uncharacterized protein n=1 Tax=viral metagenome TaxID=1070528 RepID=A0A6C0H7M8_9ZZZZ
MKIAINVYRYKKMIKKYINIYINNYIINEKLELS